MNIIDMVHQQLGQGEIQQISQKLGIDPATAQQAVQAAVPTIVGGMAGKAEQPGGANALQSAIDAHAGAGGASGGLGNILADTSAGGLLGRVLGEHKPAVQERVQQASGLDAAKAQQLMTMLGPVIMRAIAQHQASGQSQSGGQGLGGLLKEAAQAAGAGSGGSSANSGVLDQIFGQ
jgi:hypothetical protein